MKMTGPQSPGYPENVAVEFTTSEPTREPDPNTNSGHAGVRSVETEIINSVAKMMNFTCAGFCSKYGFH